MFSFELKNTNKIDIRNINPKNDKFSKVLFGLFCPLQPTLIQFRPFWSYLV